MSSRQLHCPALRLYCLPLFMLDPIRVPPSFADHRRVDDVYDDVEVDVGVECAPEGRVRRLAARVPHLDLPLELVEVDLEVIERVSREKI